MVGIEVVRDVAVFTCPGFEGLKLAPVTAVRDCALCNRLEFLLWLTHIGVEVIEVTQLLCPESRVRIRRIVPLVMLNVHEYIVFFC
jgi:hypothetical protein